MPESKQCKKESLEIRLNPDTLGKMEQFKGVVVACSGGVDSTVLFRLLWEIFRQKKKFFLAICHTNFGLRGTDSDQDQAFVERVAEKYGVPFFLQKITQEQRENRRGQSIQEWARGVRYDHFRTLADDGWVVALGHHENDLAENIILRLARGTSPDGLPGLKEWHPPFWRPLLSCSRKSIESYAELHGIAFREDASNQKPDYARNRIRHEVLPLLEELYPGAVGRIARCGKQAGELSSLCAGAWDTEIRSLSGAGLSAKWLASESRTLQHLILSRGIGVARKGRKALSNRLLDLISGRIEEFPEQDWETCLPAGKGRIVLRKGLLRIEKISNNS